MNPPVYAPLHYKGRRRAGSTPAVTGRKSRPRSVRPFAAAYDPPPDAGAALLAQIVDRVLGSPSRRDASYRVRCAGGRGGLVDALLADVLAGDPERRLLAEPCVLRRGRALLELLLVEATKGGS